MAEAQAIESTNPLKLALSLNYACFKYESDMNFEHAVDIANTAFVDCLNLFQSLDGKDKEATLKVMILLDDNIAVFREAAKHQAKKAEMVEFDERALELLRKGFREEELVSLAGSSIISYETLV